MKGSLAITLLATLASQAAASFRFSYGGGGDSYAFPDLSGSSDFIPIVFAYSEVPALQQWEFDPVEGSSDGKVLIRNSFTGEYIYCSLAAPPGCRMEETGTPMKTEVLGESGNQKIYHVLADVEDLDDPVVLMGGESLEFGLVNDQDYSQWIYVEELAE